MSGYTNHGTDGTTNTDMETFFVVFFPITSSSFQELAEKTICPLSCQIATSTDALAIPKFERVLGCKLCSLTFREPECQSI